MRSCLVREDNWCWGCSGVEEEEKRGKTTRTWRLNLNVTCTWADAWKRLLLDQFVYFTHSILSGTFISISGLRYIDPPHKQSRNISWYQNLYVSKKNRRSKKGNKRMLFKAIMKYSVWKSGIRCHLNVVVCPPNFARLRIHFRPMDNKNRAYSQNEKEKPSIRCWGRT